MTPKEKLLKLLPREYRARVRDLTQEFDLTDDCKYLLSWTDEFTDGGRDGRGASFPVKSLKEAAEFVRESLYKYEERK